MLIIRAWDPKTSGMPSGPKLEKAVLEKLDIELSYPGMFKHAGIKKAFDERKEQIASGKPPKRPPTPEVELLLQRIERRDAEIERLTATLANYRELFIRHHYNAKRRGLTIADLEAPVPAMVQYDDGKHLK